MQITNQHFRNATNRTFAFFRFKLEIRLFRIDPISQRSIQNMISDCEEKKGCAESHFRSNCFDDTGY